MTVEERPQSTSDASKNKLRKQVIELRRRLERSEAKIRALWFLLEEITDRMQVSSAGIKAAVTSLLDYDIVWDGATEHDFLEIINNNVDDVSREVMLITLASKIETGQLELVPEPNSIQEIISNVIDIVSNEFSECTFEVDISAQDMPIFVDFDYTVMALLFLFEFILEKDNGLDLCKINIKEVNNDYMIQISNVNKTVRDLIFEIEEELTEGLMWRNELKSSHKLKLFVLGSICDTQNIQISTHEADDSWEIHVAVPVVQEI